MKKNFALVMALGAGFLLASCHSSESAYKKAYEKAQAQQTSEDYTQQYTSTTQVQQETPVQVSTVTPVQGTQAVTTDYSNVSYRTESVSLVEGAGLKDYSVIVGSFGMLTNAQGLKSTLANDGYSAQIVQADVNGKPFYRVAATTHATKSEAAQSRARLVAKYPDAWLLYKK